MYNPMRTSPLTGMFKYREFGGMRASGGNVYDNAFYRVGENKPEIFSTLSGKQYFIPHERGMIKPLVPTQQAPPPPMSGSRTNINMRGGDIYINIDGANANPQEIASAIKRELGDYLSLTDRRVEATLSGAGRV
jgi:hypothetical protein